MHPILIYFYYNINIFLKTSILSILNFYTIFCQLLFPWVLFLVWRPKPGLSLCISLCVEAWEQRNSSASPEFTLPVPHSFSLPGKECTLWNGNSSPTLTLTQTLGIFEQWRWQGLGRQLDSLTQQLVTAILSAFLTAALLLGLSRDQISHWTFALCFARGFQYLHWAEARF